MNKTRMNLKKNIKKLNRIKIKFLLKISILTQNICVKEKIIELASKHTAS